MASRRHVRIALHTTNLSNDVLVGRRSGSFRQPKDVLLTANDGDMIDCMVRAAIASKLAEWPMRSVLAGPARPPRRVCTK